MRKASCCVLGGGRYRADLSFPQIGGSRAERDGCARRHIYNEDMKTPVRNVVVKLRNIATQKEYESDHDPRDCTASRRSTRAAT